VLTPDALARLLVAALLLACVLTGASLISYLEGRQPYAVPPPVVVRLIYFQLPTPWQQPLPQQLTPPEQQPRFDDRWPAAAELTPVRQVQQRPAQSVAVIAADAFSRLQLEQPALVTKGSDSPVRQVQINHSSRVRDICRGKGRIHFTRNGRPSWRCRR
jgi:hypothetical protein